VNPAVGVGRIARAWDTLYLLDACQAAGQLVLDVEQLGCDFLTATGRKFLRGPRGSGFLHVREERIHALEPLFLDLRGARWPEAGHYQPRADARRFESWESSVAVRLGLGAAVDYALELGVANLEARIRRLAERLRARLEGIPGVTVADRGIERCGIVTCQLKGDSPERVRQALRQRDINVSVAQAESARLDMDARGLDSLLRASVHAYNTEDELERFARELEALVRPPR
ncbi:MAG TPA: aminotransferase class V-fold PLP-dependent enzyme, partial [Chromatiales bacterium]|nr:aminotransferase class V-fold PLP-dependent enzyme [Chromatiales bacterium]